MKSNKILNLTLISTLITFICLILSTFIFAFDGSLGYGAPIPFIYPGKEFIGNAILSILFTKDSYIRFDFYHFIISFIIWFFPIMGMTFFLKFIMQEKINLKNN